MRPLNTSLLLQLVTPATIGKRSIVMSVSVCLCACVRVCLSSVIPSKLHVRSLPISVHVTVAGPPLAAC